MSVAILDKYMTMGPVIPVVALDRADDAVPLAEALLAGGVNIIEVTLRTEAAKDAMKAITKSVPEMVLSAGTVTNMDQFKTVADLGCKFAISPGLTENLAKDMHKVDIPLLPGIASSSDIMRGLDYGLERFKLFPAVNVGGVGMLKALGGPFPDIRFCPTGGINIDNASAFLALKNVHCVGASWLAARDLIKAGNWAEITNRANQAAALG